MRTIRQARRTPTASEALPVTEHLAIGIDIGKDSQWVTAMTDAGTCVYHARVASTPEATAALLTTLPRRHRRAPCLAK